MDDKYSIVLPLTIAALKEMSLLHVLAVACKLFTQIQSSLCSTLYIAMLTVASF
jgi:hypothetical protein